jgi:hypothetical protein
MCVFKAYLALRGLANVGHYIFTFDGVAPYEFCHRGVNSTFVVYKVAQALAFKKRNTPAISMFVGAASALAKSSEAKCGVCGCFAVERE